MISAPAPMMQSRPMVRCSRIVVFTPTKELAPIVTPPQIVASEPKQRYYSQQPFTQLMQGEGLGCSGPWHSSRAGGSAILLHVSPRAV